MKLTLILFKKLSIFSDGSLLLELNVSNVEKKSVITSNKDLQSFQKLFKTSSLKSLSVFNTTSNTDMFRKKLFK